MSTLFNIPKDHPTFIYHNDIEDIVRPLRELLNINYFCFNRIYHNGKHIALTTNPVWFLRCYNNRYYLKEEISKTGIVGNFYPIVWDYVIDIDKLSYQAMFDARNHNFAHLFSLKYISMKYFDLYSMSVPEEEHQANTKYLQYYELIKKFTLYFQSTAAFIINKAEKNPISVNNLTEFQSTEDDIISKLDQFEQQIKVLQLNLNLNEFIIKLTITETKYLKALALGMSSKSIAKKFNVSTRTVETHINNLKSKLGVHCKSEIAFKLNSQGVNFNMI